MRLAQRDDCLEFSTIHMDHDQIPDEDMVIYPMPSLVATLLQAEERKGSPLTEREVLAICDKSPSVVLPRKIAAKVTEGRGYQDIDPENCWVEWQEIRGKYKSEWFGSQ